MTSAEIPEIGVRDLARELAGDVPPQVIDVREPWEWMDGHIDGATHIPLGELAARLGGLDRDRPLAFICHLGARSARATALARAAGHGKARNVVGGMDAWAREGFPVSQDAGG